MVKRLTYEEKLKRFGLDEEASVKITLDAATRASFFAGETIRRKLFAANVQWDLKFHHERDDRGKCSFLAVKIDYDEPILEGVENAKICFMVSLETDEAPETSYITRHRFAECYKWDVFSEPWIVHLMKTDLYRDLGGNTIVKVTPTKKMIPKNIRISAGVQEPHSFYSDVFRKVGTDFTRNKSTEQLDYAQLIREEPPKPTERRKQTSVSNKQSSSKTPQNSAAPQTKQQEIFQHYYAEQLSKSGVKRKAPSPLQSEASRSRIEDQQQLSSDSNTTTSNFNISDIKVDIPDEPVNDASNQDSSRSIDPMSRCDDKIRKTIHAIMNGGPIMGHNSRQTDDESSENQDAAGNNDEIQQIEITNIKDIECELPKNSRFYKEGVRFRDGLISKSVCKRTENNSTSSNKNHTPEQNTPSSDEPSTDFELEFLREENKQLTKQCQQKNEEIKESVEQNLKLREQNSSLENDNTSANNKIMELMRELKENKRTIKNLEKELERYQT